MFKLDERTRTQIFATITGGIVIGAILWLGSSMWALHARMAGIEAKQDVRASSEAAESTRPPIGMTPAKSEDLIPLIQEEQRLRVKESLGELAWQCFTDDDLRQFIENKTTENMTESLKRGPRFLDVVAGIRQLAPGKRADLLIAANKPLHPTWGELGRVSREGQSDAGQKAEKMIAAAVVRRVKELLSLSNEQFLKLYEV